MNTDRLEFRPNAKVLDAFIKWIESKDPRHATAWGKRYCADAEAAMCEATFWGVLTDCGVTVEPNADWTYQHRAPDFVCWSGEQKFFVEVACIRIDTATRHTGLDDTVAQGVTWYSPLNDLVFGKATSKTTQCADLDAPCVLAVGTFHFSASAACVRKPFAEWLLTGETSIAWNIDTRHGGMVGGFREVTKLKSSVFVRPSPLVGVEPARTPISAVMLAGFGCMPPRILGALHPNPDWEFDPSPLSTIPFCKLKVDLEAGRLGTEWTQATGEDD